MRVSIRRRPEPSPILVLMLALRRATPLSGLIVGLAVGQVFVWCAGWYGLISLLVILGPLSFIRVNYSSILGGALVATATSLAPIMWYQPLPQLVDASFPVRIQGPPRYPKVGLIRFHAELLERPWEGQRVVISAIHLPWHNASKVEEGDTVWFRGDCAPPEVTYNPFSYSAWLRRQEISAQCKADFLSLPSLRDTPFRGYLQDAIKAKAYSVAGENEGVGLFLAMVFGFRDQLSDGTERSFKALGLTHLLVVSGYQISLIFGVILGVSARILIVTRVVLCPRNMAVYPALVAASVYVWICGSDTATVRALLAGVCIALQIWLEHPITFLHRILLAVLGLNLLFPFALFDLGVQYTIAALVGIASGSYLARRRRRGLLFLSVSLHVWLCTSVLTILWFGRVPLASLPMNVLLAAPWATCNCIVGTVGLALSLLPVPFADCILKLTAYLNQLALEHIRYISWLTEGLEVMCEGAVERLSVAALFLLVIGILWRPALRELVVSQGRSAII